MTNQQQEQELLNAFRKMTPEDQAWILAISTRRTAQKPPKQDIYIITRKTSSWH